MLGQPGFYIGLGASLVPITLGLDGMRQCLFGTEMGLLPLWIELIVLVLLTVLFFFLARGALRKMENLGKKEGRLTLKWQ